MITLQFMFHDFSPPAHYPHASGQAIESVRLKFESSLDQAQFESQQEIARLRAQEIQGTMLKHDVDDDDDDDDDDDSSDIDRQWR